jgi:hypothetical protein
MIICKATGVVLSLALVGAFLWTIKSMNFSLLFFSAFVIFGAFGKGEKNGYVKVYNGFSTERLKRGIKVERFAVDKSTTIKKIISLMSSDSLNEVLVYDGEIKVATLSQKQINDIILYSNIYAPIGEYVK